MITNQQELKAMMAANPIVAQLPVERKKLGRVMKKLLTKSVELEERETLVLMHSALQRFRLISNHMTMLSCHLQVPNRETTTAACKTQLTNRGKCTVHGTADGQNIAIPFQDTDVELPIASVQTQICKSGNTVMSHEDGGKM